MLIADCIHQWISPWIASMSSRFVPCWAMTMLKNSITMALRTTFCMITVLKCVCTWSRYRLWHMGFYARPWPFSIPMIRHRTVSARQFIGQSVATLYPAVKLAYFGLWMLKPIRPNTTWVSSLFTIRLCASASCWTACEKAYSVITHLMLKRLKRHRCACCTADCEQHVLTT